MHSHNGRQEDHRHGTAGHHHHGGLRTLGFPIVLNLTITVVQIVGGLMSNSLALLSDAFHNFVDTFSLGVAYFSEKLARKPSDEQRTYGYKRAEMIGALLNTVLLFVVGFFLVKASVERFFHPAEIHTGIMLVVAAIGLAANLLSAGLLFAGSKENLNIRTAFIHLMSDSLHSALVIIGALVIRYYKLNLIDAILALAIAVYVIVQGILVMKRIVGVLMQSVPLEIPVAKLKERIQKVKLVEGIHHVHVWSLNERDIFFECHVVVKRKDLIAMEKIKKAIKVVLRKEFSIEHSTLEFEHGSCDVGEGVCYK